MSTFSANGEYVITSFSIYDEVGNGYDIWSSANGFDSFVAENNIQQSFVVQGASEDSVAPLVSGLSLDSTTYDVSQPGGVFAGATLSFSDDASGFDYAYATYTNIETGQEYDFYFDDYKIYSGSTLQG